MIARFGFDEARRVRRRAFLARVEREVWARTRRLLAEMECRRLLRELRAILSRPLTRAGLSRLEAIVIELEELLDLEGGAR